MLADERFPLEPNEIPQVKRIRFSGHWARHPLTAGVESQAMSLAEIVAEVLGASQSERQGRVIDQDGAGSMERKKQEGYF